MKIAIVEDHLEDAEHLATLLREYCTRANVGASIVHFTDAVAFVDKLRTEMYDLIFMDIDMPRMNGMEASRLLREVDQSAALFFVTNMQRYAIKGYEVHAFDFCIKPITYETLEYKLNRFLSSYRRTEKKAITLRNRESIYRVAVNDIFYVEVEGHTLRYHTVQGIIEIRGTMKDAEKLLSDSQFALCNVCYLVNLRYVTSVEGVLVTVGGKSLKISRPKRKQFMERLQSSI